MRRARRALAAVAVAGLFPLTLWCSDPRTAELVRRGAHGATDEEAGFEIPFEKRLDVPCPNSCGSSLSPLNKCDEATNQCSCAEGLFGADCTFVANKQCGVNVGPLQATVNAHFSKGGYDGLVQCHAHMILANQVLQNKVPSDVVELGVYKGGSSSVLVNVFETCSAKKFWLYDSYEGHPAIDGAKNPGMEGWEGKHVGTLEQAKANVQALNPTLNIENNDRIIWKKGFFNETLLQPLPSTIAYLHIDCDWYECIVDSLNTFYDRVAWGGVIILDDVGIYGFARAGLMEWVRRRKIVPALRSTFGVGEALGGGSHFWVKGYQGSSNDQSVHNKDPLWPGGVSPAAY